MTCWGRCGRPAMPHTSSAGRCATSSWTAGRPTGTSRPTPVRSGSSSCSPGAVYENRFGTVAVRRDGDDFEITTFRTDHDYADFRRPHRVEFGDTIEVDLARRDFTVNAMAWGARAQASRRPSSTRTTGGPTSRRGSSAPSATRRARFEEDALRMVRAVRLAATLDFEVEAATLAGIEARAELVAHLSGERIAAELDKLLAAPAPSMGLRLMSDTGLLAAISPDLAAQRGIPQNKVPGEDLWDHTLRSVDAAPAVTAGRPAGRPPPRHRQAGDLRRRPLPGPRRGRSRAGRRVPGPSAIAAGRADAGRRARSQSHVQLRTELVGRGRSPVHRQDRVARRGLLDDLLALREADNVGSGLPPMAGRLDELRARIAAELAAEVVLDRSGLAIDGADLMSELGLGQGPLLGRILDELLERVIADPALNDRPTLLLLAQAMLTEDR